MTEPVIDRYPGPVSNQRTGEEMDTLPLYRLYEVPQLSS